MIVLRIPNKEATMAISEKIELLGNDQVQRILKEVDYDELAIVMAYHLNDNAQNIITSNMSDGGNK
ncbi:hypothetical protein ACFL47_07675 [Candidatus Latescibacterota bacterium]